MPKCVMEFKGYNVNHINYLFNENFLPVIGGINIVPIFKKELIKIDENNALSKLMIIIDNKEKSLPFSIDIEITGKFFLEKWEEKKENTVFMRSNTIAILFPYLRALVSSVTLNSNIPPYILPLMNINSWFENEANNI